jgi:3-phenylpropionate/trans-cinnamate dioxygenase ferredoxin subunit
MSALMPSNWIYVLDDEALSEGQMLAAYPLGLNLLFARIGGAVYAVSGKCAHMGCSLFMGKLDGFTITCPCHDWSFDIRTGRFLDAPELGLALFPTKTETGKVFVNLS